MVSVFEAKGIVDAYTAPKSKINNLTADLIGLHLAECVVACCDVPPFDNSAMDGYAVHYQPDKKIYLISQKIRAGEVSTHRLGLGEAARVYTGAPVPLGADTVIQQEHISLQENVISLSVNTGVRGMNIRLRGSQCKTGELVAASGSLITPGLIGLLASVGITQVSIFEPSVVGIIVTGDELLPPGAPLLPGKIYNSNGIALQSYCKLLNITPQIIMQVPDDPAIIRNQMAICLERCDILLLSGGISVGDYDYIQESLRQEGVEKLFYKVKQKPGKPLFFGKKNDTLVFGLPGNPAAALTCFNQYVKPCIQKKIGYSDVWKPDAMLSIESHYRKPSGLTHFLKAKKNNQTATILERQQSFDLLSFNQADCFVEIPEAESEIEKEAILPIYYW